MVEDDFEVSVSVDAQFRDPDDLLEILQEDPTLVKLGDVFDAEFMAENTDYTSLDEFSNGMPDSIDFGTNLEDIPVMATLSSDDPAEKQALDSYVADSTSFKNWADLQSQAKSRMAKLWMIGELDPA